MKYIRYSALNILLIAFVIQIIACSNKSNHIAYQCPMECQIDTVFKYEGKCPICKMELIGIDTIAEKTTIINNFKQKQ